MAWTVNTQAAAVFGAENVTRTLGTIPFLIKKATVVADSTTYVEFIHGETTAPDIIFITDRSASPGTTNMSIQDPSAVTLIKIDAEAAATGDVYMIWLDQASGGISA